MTVCYKNALNETKASVSSTFLEVYLFIYISLRTIHYSTYIFIRILKIVIIIKLIFIEVITAFMRFAYVPPKQSYILMKQFLHDCR